MDNCQYASAFLLPTFRIPLTMAVELDAWELPSNSRQEDTASQEAADRVAPAQDHLSSLNSSNTHNAPMPERTSVRCSDLLFI